MTCPRNFLFAANSVALVAIVLCGCYPRGKKKKRGKTPEDAGEGSTAAHQRWKGEKVPPGVRAFHVAHCPAQREGARRKR